MEHSFNEKLQSRNTIPYFFLSLQSFYYFLSQSMSGVDDPFNEIESGQILIGVANIFLTCLLQDASLCYSVPIINQLGQVIRPLQ